MCKLTPDLCLAHATDLSVSWLTRHGVRLLLLDLDNTLAPYEQPEPDDALLAWLSSLSDAGIRCAIVSNNGEERVRRFTSAGFSVPYYTHARKPFSRTFRRAIKEAGVRRDETAAMGDQIYTDLLAARGAGVPFVVIVPPLRDRRDLLTRFKRLCERPVMRAYARKHKRREQDDRQEG